MSDPAFAQLLDMGIPGGRARAALRRSKGDVLSATERVFAGEFDDIPSDDEGDEEDASAPPEKGRTTTGLKTPNHLQSSSIPHQTSSRLPSSILTLDDEDDVMCSDAGDIYADSYDKDFQDDDDEMTESRLRSDPYAGIFFSKERVERINEAVETEEYVDVPLPSNTAREGSGKGDKRITVRLLQRGEWMSGCPEGNEQSYLFQLYSMLEAGSMVCSAGCGHHFKRNKQDFFVVFSSFSDYTSYLHSKIRQTCPKCSRHTCLACGETSDRSSALANESNDSTPNARKGKGKEVADQNESALFHCPNLQGVVLGIGLHMIEQTFKQGNGDINTNSPSKRSPPSKKRKGNMQKVVNQFTAKPPKGLAPTVLASEGGGEESDNDSDLGDYGAGIGINLGSKAASSRGTGYAGSAREDRSGQLKAEQAQADADRMLTRLLSQVRVYLPSLKREGGARTSDHLVHPTALAHLRRRSAFVNDLLRDDSLLDMSNRGDLYRALFDWLEIVSNHEALASMLAMPQMRPIQYDPAPDDSLSVIVTYEGSASPRELLENCVIQAQAALKGLNGPVKRETDGGKLTPEEDLQMSKATAEQIEREKKEELNNDANIHLREFCNRIITSAQDIDRSLIETKGRAFVKRMRESLPRLPDAGVKVEEHTLEGDSAETTIRIYEEWAGRARFQYCDMVEQNSSTGRTSYKHAHSSMIVGLEGMDMPKRSLAIAKELAILTTSLPVAWHSTIFLRVDEVRVDCLKAMIIGPEGTPYENGCFIFDIFLPLDYNHKCPLVKSMTTNGGKYRYNPNLYADGKVCLSLLGTWQGPGWISGHSTLLQVLISIQSLILCEEPYLNEPGFAGHGGSASSKAYSANVRRMVLIDAMANNLKQPPHPFNNEIKTHFRLKAKSIREQIDRWKALDDGKSVAADSNVGPTAGSMAISASETAFDRAAGEVRRLLDELDPLSSDTKPAVRVAKGKTKGKAKDGKVKK